MEKCLYPLEIRKRCLELSHMGGDGNLQSCFSSIEILCSLYNDVLNWSVGDALSSDRDIFVLSKGQSSLAHVVVLEKLGLFNSSEVVKFCQFGSKFSMQVDYTKFKGIGGIENSAGSLGHGFPMAVGMAYALKIKKRNNRIFVLAGDGEMNEGTMWEACVFASSHDLDNLTLIIDDNNSANKMVRVDNLAERISSFGFEGFSAAGHDCNDITGMLEKCKKIRNKPQALIARTVRGYGSKTLMENNEWFHKAPNETELNLLMREVNDFEKSNDQICR